MLHNHGYAGTVTMSIPRSERIRAISANASVSSVCSKTSSMVTTSTDDRSSPVLSALPRRTCAIPRFLQYAMARGSLSIPAVGPTQDHASIFFPVPQPTSRIRGCRRVANRRISINTNRRFARCHQWVSSNSYKSSYKYDCMLYV